jgi:hypothetical protein
MKQSWYHCGHCGSLFESGSGADESRLCAVCGRKPGTGIWPAEEAHPYGRDRRQPAFGRQGEALDEGGKRAVRKKRKKSMMMRVVVVWIVVMSLLVWKRTNQAREEAERKALRNNAGKGNLAEGTMADERIALLSQALPDCHRALAGFLTGGTPEIRNQFVADPIGTAGKMAAFYQVNAFPHVEVKALKRIGQEPIRVGDEWMIETRWQGEEGVEFDAVFRRDGAIWKLDWDHFSRYGGYSWPLFLAGEGPEEAEFRLLARKVTVGGSAERGGSRLRFTLLSPVFGKAAETGMQSPELVVDRRSDEGLLLEAAFDAREDGRSFFGGTMKAMEPEGLVRVRVRIKRGEFGGVRSFGLVKVIACHWIGTDQVGFDLDILRDDLFNN